MLLTLSSRPLAPAAAARRLSSVGGAAHAPLPRAGAAAAAAAAAAKPARRTRLARAASANLSPGKSGAGLGVSASGPAMCVPGDRAPHTLTHSLASLRRALPSSPLTSIPPDSAFTPELKKAIDAFIADHKVVLFIKGTKDFPQCGFSQTVRMKDGRDRARS